MKTKFLLPAAAVCALLSGAGTAQADSTTSSSDASAWGMNSDQAHTLNTIFIGCQNAANSWLNEGASALVIRELFTACVIENGNRAALSSSIPSPEVPPSPSSEPPGDAIADLLSETSI